MARFTVRIELVNASWDQYKQMYAHLERHGIVDIITSDQGARYRLPPAEYNYDGNASRDQVLEMAKSSAAKVVRDYRVLVTESAGRTWHNLEKA
jgi:hypothetical protein